MSKRMKRRRIRKQLGCESLETRMLLAGDFLAQNALDLVVVNHHVESPIESRPIASETQLANETQLTSETQLGGRNRDGGGQNNGGEQNDGLARPAEIRTIDGTENNIDNPDWGATEVQLVRLTDADYEDGLSEPSGADRPSAREVSNAVAAQTDSTVNDRGLTDLSWLWGQFIDHDIDLTEGADPAESFNIAVPTGDAYFDPFGTGTVEISLSRSAFDTDTGTESVREQINSITAFLDGSGIYGSDQERADAIRTFEGGQLATSDGDLLPWNFDGYDNAGGPSDTLYLAGDIRANENAALSAMHSLWVREHNRIASNIAENNPDLTDEQIFQQARRIVIGEIQAITFNEFLPALLGEGTIQRYEGYDSSVNSSIANEFSTAAYRFGHSMLSTELLRLNNDGTVADEGNLALRDAFFNPQEIVENGIDTILKGVATNAAQEIDTQVVDDVRNFLFGPPGAGGFDLASLNIQRGRDHGLASYTEVREQLGLPTVASFDQISSDPDVQVALASVYDSVDQVDLWVGGLAEDHLPGSSMGETNSAIIADQFERIRDGDRFWYQRTFSGEQLQRIDSTTLADVIQRNSGVENLPDNVFFTADAQPDRPPRPGDGPRGGNQDPPPPPPANLGDTGPESEEESTEVGTGRPLPPPPTDEATPPRPPRRDGPGGGPAVDVDSDVDGEEDGEEDGGIAVDAIDEVFAQIGLGGLRGPLR